MSRSAAFLARSDVLRQQIAAAIHQLAVAYSASYILLENPAWSQAPSN